jgi:MFS family permease
MSPRGSSQQLKMTRRAALGGLLGTALEYFDFTMYGIVAAIVFSKVFFPAGNPLVASSGAMASFGVAYAARPIGALVLGNLGDRIGRQKMLLFTISLMGLATFLIGCIPDYATIGVAAPILLVILRLVQGFSAAGEQAGSSSLTMEHAPANKRSFYTSWTNTGTQLGTAMGQLAFLPVLALPHQDFIAWGWRVPFLLSALGVVVVFFIRKGLRDSDAFLTRKTSADTETFPIRALFRSHWRNLVRVVLCCLMAAPGYVVSVFSLSYAVNTVGIPAQKMLPAGVIASVLGMISIPFWALLSDRVGRRPVFIFGLLAAGLLIFPSLYFTAAANIPMIYVFSIAFTVFLMAGQALQLSIYTEMFQTKVRFSGVAVGTQFGYLIAGFAPTISYAVLKPGPFGWAPVALLCLVCCLVASASAFTARETRGLSLSELDGSTPPQTARPGEAGPARRDPGAAKVSPP